MMLASGSAPQPIPTAGAAGFRHSRPKPYEPGRSEVTRAHLHHIRPALRECDLLLSVRLEADDLCSRGCKQRGYRCGIVWPAARVSQGQGYDPVQLPVKRVLDHRRRPRASQLYHRSRSSPRASRNLHHRRSRRRWRARSTSRFEDRSEGGTCPASDAAKLQVFVSLTVEIPEHALAQRVVPPSAAARSLYLRTESQVISALLIECVQDVIAGAADRVRTNRDGFH